jgi:energy-coupling factor transporter ATP-binding protein EcfA2
VVDELAPLDERSLEIDSLTVRYYGRDEDALTDIDLSVRAGELVGVAGRNGAGKSTLALATAGFIPRIVRAKVGGAIRVDGEALVDADTAHAGAGGATTARRHRVGIVFSNPTNQLSATKTSVREEIAFGLENMGIERDEMEQRLDAVLERLRIGHLAERSPFALSGGEQQRVAIASIVAMGMGVLVLDEPTAQLDPLSTQAVADLLRELAADGTAVLVAEHASAVLGATERCIVLDGGRVVTEDVPGRALGTATLGPLGQQPPTDVLLAELAGVDPARAWDGEAVAAAWRAGVARRSGVGPIAPAPAKPWVPVRDQPPLGIGIRDLVHRYASGVEAVRGISLDIDPGEAVAIVGQNGSGKTTLVKHLNGLLRPTEGSILLGGRDTAQDAIFELASRVGFVFQNPDDQLFNRSVAREVAFGPRNLRLPKADEDRLVELALDALGLTEDRDENPYDLNVSSRKLVALASVIAMDPAILVLDEPTTGQDGPGRERVGAVVERFRAAGRTVVAITHDMEFAAEHFPRIVVMRHGEVVADGPPSEIFSSVNTELLGSTGLRPPVTARLAGRLGLTAVPLDPAALLAEVAQ